MCVFVCCFFFPTTLSARIVRKNKNNNSTSKMMRCNCVFVCVFSGWASVWASIFNLLYGKAFVYHLAVCFDNVFADCARLCVCEMLKCFYSSTQYSRSTLFCVWHHPVCKRVYIASCASLCRSLSFSACVPIWMLALARLQLCQRSIKRLHQNFPASFTICVWRRYQL